MTSPALDTTAVVDLAIAGDRAAFGPLYQQYAEIVFKYVYYRVATRHLAEDITSETFIRAMKNVAGYDHRGRDFGAWLVTIARNLIADHFKRSSTRLETPTADMFDGDEREPAVDGTVLAALDAAAVRSALQHLNDLQRECLILRFFQGLTITETAAVMGSNEGAIKSLQARAVGALERSPHLKRGLTVDDSGTRVIALPAGFRAVADRTLFQCGANASLHPMARHKITTAVKQATWTAARAAGIRPISAPVRIRAVQHPAPGVRALDVDNIGPIVKAAIDGLKGPNGILRDDSPAYVVQVTYEIGERRAGSQLVLHITPITDTTEGPNP